MISFRYHLVSVIAIFLAIAVGVVIGTTVLNGAVVSDLHRQVTDLKAANQAAAAENAQIRGSAGNADELVTAYGAKILGTSLANDSVVLVGTPSASSDLMSGLAAKISAAGGTVTGQLQLTNALTDPARAADVLTLTTSVHPAGLTLPTSSDAGTLAGSLLGYVLLGHGVPTDLVQALAGFQSLNMIKPIGTVAAGKVVLLVAPGAKPAGDSAAPALDTLTVALATAGPTVVVGDSAAASAGGLIASLRGNDAAKHAVSTVDDIDRPIGQFTSMLAIAAAAAGKRGDYGTSAGTDALFPGSS